MNGPENSREWPSGGRGQFRRHAAHGAAEPCILWGVEQGDKAPDGPCQPILGIQQRRDVLELGHHAPPGLAQPLADRRGPPRAHGARAHRKNPVRRPSSCGPLRSDLAGGGRVSQAALGRAGIRRSEWSVEKVCRGGRAQRALRVTRRPGHCRERWTAGRGSVARRPGQWWTAGRATPLETDPPAGPVRAVSALWVTRRPGTSIDLPSGPALSRWSPCPRLRGSMA